jgi:tRNA U34 5-methylaminomethyl-2-thiouridine-forming methyltransferase MnmC
MQRNLIVTEDGSHSIYVPELDENYHSTHGAIQESQHVFIESGLKHCTKSTLSVLEIGFGTGLNALLTLLESTTANLNVSYVGVEKYPLTSSEYQLLNYPKELGHLIEPSFLELHQCDWEKEHRITSNFTLFKTKIDANSMDCNAFQNFDLIYFDAFAPNKQNDLWNQSLFQQIYNHSNPGAVFVTYCAKGVVRRDLLQVGFSVERIPGPPGKKEMLRAIK